MRDDTYKARAASEAAQGVLGRGTCLDVGKTRYRGRGGFLQIALHLKRARQLGDARQPRQRETRRVPEVDVAVDRRFGQPAPALS